MKSQWTDHLAFWAINHLLSRPRHQKFDLGQFETFVSRWSGARHEEFYDLTNPGQGWNDAIETLKRCSIPGRSIKTFTTTAPCPFPENNHIWVEFHLGKPWGEAPMFFIQHGWRSVSVGGYHQMCRKLNAMGVNAGVLHLPYHFSKRPPGSFNGELAITSDVVRSAHALRQGVRDVSWLGKLMKELGVPHVGLWGTSYGGWIAAMAITVDSGFDAAVLVEPPIEIEELFWDIPLFSNLQKELKRLEIPRERIQELFRLVTPYHHSLKLDPARVLILGSEHDPIGYPDSLKKLHAAWPGSYLEIFPYGHISYKIHASALERFTSHLVPHWLK